MGGFLVVGVINTIVFITHEFYLPNIANLLYSSTFSPSGFSNTENETIK